MKESAWWIASSALFSTPRLLEDGKNCAEVVLMVKNEEGHHHLHSAMQKMRASQGRAPTSGWIDTSFTHSRVEVGGNINGFHHGISHDKEATWFHYHGSGQVDQSSALYSGQVHPQSKLYSTSFHGGNFLIPWLVQGYNLRPRCKVHLKLLESTIPIIGNTAKSQHWKSELSVGRNVMHVCDGEPN